MPTMFMNTVIAAFAAAGLALTSVTGFEPTDSYGGSALSSLSQSEAASHALHVFMRADRNMDQTLDVDEFTALAIITAEMAHLNGFVAIDNGGAIRTIALPVVAPVVLTPEELVRIDAVSRHTFYAFAGGDGRIDAKEYINVQNAVFALADQNANGLLVKDELAAFALRQAQLTTGV